MDICKAFVISYKNLGLATTVDRNDYRFSRPYRSLAQECNTFRSKTNLKGLRDLMYTRFAIKENIPCRVAYDKACYRYSAFYRNSLPKCILIALYKAGLFFLTFSKKLKPKKLKVPQNSRKFQPKTQRIGSIGSGLNLKLIFLDLFEL